MTGMASISPASGSFLVRPLRPRTVVHLNVADFAVAVERRVDQRLCNRPVIIAPEESPRAVVYDMSEEAFQAGVRKQMPLMKAVRCCRDAVVLSPHPDPMNAPWVT